MNPVSAVLIAAVTLSSVPSFAADPTQERVEQALVKPLAVRERLRSRLSRVMLPPQQRRVRVPDAQAQKDADGLLFVNFAIDARHGFELDLDEGAGSENGWRKDAFTGCVYPATGEIFVLLGTVYYPAATLFGKKTGRAAQSTCRAAREPVVSAK